MTFPFLNPPSNISQEYQDKSFNLYALDSLNKNDNQYIFTSNNKEPLFFYIPDKKLKSKYEENLIKNGGILLDSYSTQTDSDKVIVLSNTELSDYECSDIKLIDDSIETGKLVNISDYKIKKSELVINKIKKPKTKYIRTHIKFTPEKDDFILKKIRLTPRLRQSHKFFEELAKEKILEGHTGNSLRSRFRQFLEKRLDYVFKVNNDGEIVYNSDGEIVTLDKNEIPYTLKVKYNSNDDYLLCKEALDFIEKNNLKKSNQFAVDKKISLPFGFFKYMHDKHPRHTHHSWRDRYRRYIGDDTLHNYISYYDLSIKNGLEPETLKKINIQNEKKLTVYNDNTEKKEDQGNAIYCSFDTNLKNDDTNFNILDTSKEIKKSNDDFYNNDLLYTQNPIQMNNLYENFDNFSDQETEFNDKLNECFDSKECFYKDTFIKIEYLNNFDHIEDLLSDGTIILLKEKSFISTVVNIIKKSKSLIELYDFFATIGVQSQLTSHVIYSTNADAFAIQNYFCLFFNKIKKYVIKKKTINFKKIMDVFSRVGNGIWCKNQDIVLNTMFEDRLLQIHSKSQINLRKKFLSKINN